MKLLRSLVAVAVSAVAVSGCKNSVSESLPQHCEIPALPGGEEQVAAFTGFEHFIRRDGIQLLDGDEPVRFIGLHATELHLIEDDAASKGSTIGRSDHFRWPSAREQANWIKSLVYSGHSITRIYTLSVDDIELPQEVRVNMRPHIVKNLQTGAIELDESAMQVFDRMVYLADQYGLRLIVPVIDHWSWWGGKHELAKMVGEGDRDTKEDGPLYDVSSKTYAAYASIIEQLLTRKNTCTGREYREEKSIMAWETGNELRGTNKEFLAETAALFKRIAPNQLVVDGDQQADYSNPPDSADIESGEFLGLLDPNVDLQSNHFYGPYMSPEVVRKQAALARKFNKPLFIGEYGLQPIESIRAVTDTWVNEPSVAGALVWGYRGHREAGGFYWHYESDGHMSYHLPGFAVNEKNQESAVIDMIRAVQAKISGNARAEALSQTWPVPEAPWLHPVGESGAINWMGSPTAKSYRLYRSSDGGENWTLYADELIDAKNDWDPQTMDLYREAEAPGLQCFNYRLTAVNERGESAPSNIEKFCGTQLD
ncbi:cellulase family glycosylhydrolase [Microbulbifer harenosus]|uniref:mannan endo-1,4-beta-mannosidase n=1 Tax=Microbulbifer harenosus TaxID=2576840 RepID=A0ABY2UE68_9GAMM|nr:cellulase family glycosylhydrolase [Microbulbifer harenosus]TLM75249.1 glycoside hydrolase family 5 protein [Microbulbifer harenosus]